MIKEGNIGLYDAICLTSLMIISKIFYTSPGVLTKSFGTAAWYGTLVSCLVSLLFFLIIYRLMKRFPGRNIVQIFEDVLGKALGKVLGCVFCAYILYYSGSNLSEFLEMIKAYALPYTPSSIIIGSYLIVCCLIVYSGFEGMSRLTTALFIPILGGFILILLLASNHYNPNLIKPYLGYGIGRTLYLGFLRSSAYQEVLILTIYINSIHGLKNFKKAGVISLFLSAVIGVLGFLCYLMAFEYTVGSEALSGMFELSRMIYISRFFQRLESIFLFIWVISSVLTVSVAIYSAISVYCKNFHIDDHKPIIFPFVFLTYMIAMLPGNVLEVAQVNLLFIRQYSMFLVYLVPIAVLFISIILGKKGEKEGVKES